MKSRSTLSHNVFGARKARAGFTMMEIIVVMGILAIIAAMGLAFSFDAYRGYLFRAEYTGVTHIIAKARNHSVNNFNESQHGVYFDLDDEDDDKYILFRGSTYDETDPNNEEYLLNGKFDITGPGGTDTDFTVLFNQLSGESPTCDPECEITFDGGGVRVQDVVINQSGGIIWQ